MLESPSPFVVYIIVQGVDPDYYKIVASYRNMTDAVNCADNMAKRKKRVFNVFEYDDSIEYKFKKEYIKVIQEHPIMRL